MENTILISTIEYQYIGFKNYELKDHLGNVRIVFDDVKKSSLYYPLGNPPIIPNQLPFGLNVKEVNNYYPFGMLQPGLCYNSEDYRFGFNGMEKDDEIKGVGNSYTTDYGMNDPRIGGRWLSLDPIVKPWESPYAGYGNNPIVFVDPEGLDVKIRGKNKDGSIDEVKYLGSDVYSYNHTNDNWELYSGTNDYILQMRKELNDLKVDDYVIREKIENMEANKHTTTFQCIENIDLGDPQVYDTKNSTINNENWYNGKGDDVTVAFDFSAPTSAEDAWTSKKRVNIAHEIDHAFRMVNGIFTRDDEFGLPVNEIPAVNQENRIRIVLSERLRTKYSYGGGEYSPKGFIPELYLPFNKNALFYNGSNNGITPADATRTVFKNVKIKSINLKRPKE